MRTILYATDYSQNSVPALRLAHTLTQKFDAKLILLHVFDIPISLASPVSISYMKKEKKLIVEHRAKLKEFLNEHLGDADKETDINFVVDEDGSVSSGILNKATKFNADLICVGTKGTGATNEFFLGSTPKALIRKSSCPVLTVPAKSDMGSFKKMVYATDFEQADVFAINRLVKIANKFDAEIRVVHFTTKKEYAGEDQLEWFKEVLKKKVDYGKLEFDLIFADEIFEELIRYLKASEANLLAMLERKESTFYQKYLQMDLVRKMVENIDVPLLSFSLGGL